MELARKELGDQVLFMSDVLASKSFMAHYSLGEIGKAALSSGVNILLVGGYPNTAVVGDFYQAMRDVLAQERSLPNGAGIGGWYEILSGAIEGSLELRRQIEESATRIIKLKQEMLQ
jgi:beta-glucosidase-like glycosyl hydrolase